MALEFRVLERFGVLGLEGFCGFRVGFLGGLGFRALGFGVVGLFRGLGSRAVGFGCGSFCVSSPTSRIGIFISTVVHVRLNALEDFHARSCHGAPVSAGSR